MDLGQLTSETAARVKSALRAAAVAVAGNRLTVRVDPGKVTIGL